MGIKINEADFRETIKRAFDQAFGKWRQKLKKVETVDDVIDGVIPEKYSGHERVRLKDLIKKRLKEDGAIK